MGKNGTRTGGLVVKTLPANVGDVGSIPGSGRSPGGGEFHGQRSLVDGSSWGSKDLAMMR